MNNLSTTNTQPGTTTGLSVVGTSLAIGWSLVHAASVGASGYHGYKRNRSVGWALIWGLAGGIAPVLTPAIAIAQGFGKPKRAKRRGKRR